MSAPESRSWSARAVDLACLGVVLLVGVVGFAPAFGGGAPGTRALGAGACGVLLGAAVATAGAWRRWPAAVVGGITVAGYLLVAGAFVAPATTVASLVPTLDTGRAVVLAAVQSWRGLLTASLPVSSHPPLLAVPLITGLVTAVAAISWGLRAGRPAWALVPATVAFVVPIGFGGQDVALPVLRGVLVLVVGVGWLAWRRAQAQVASARGLTDEDDGGERAIGRRRLAQGVAMLVAAAAVALVVAPATAADQRRDTLRDVVTPPVDLADYPSPLQSFRKDVGELADSTLLTVDGLPQGARVRLATLEGYDGVVYDVAGSGPGGAELEPVGTDGSVPGGSLGGASGGGSSGTTAHVRVTVGAYQGVWLPDAGSLRVLTFTGARAGALESSTFYDPTSGTALTTAGLREGDTYDLDVTVPATPTDAELAGAPFATLTLPAVDHVPDSVSATAAALVGDATDPIGQVRAIQAGLSQQGFFSHGLDGQPTSRAGHTAERINTLLGGDQMVGDDEQYAVAMALMCRRLGIPARVVLGLYDTGAAASGPVELTGDDVHAWVEVAFAGRGWVPFDPTPDPSRTPQQDAPRPRSNPQPQVLQPPPPVVVPPDLPPDTAPSDDHATRSSRAHGVGGAALRLAGLGAIPVVVLLAPVVLVLAAKRRRHRRRRAAARTSDQVAGGWREVVDVAVDLGVDVSPSATRRESATALALAYPAAAITTLAARTDAHVFGAGEPTEHDVQAVWAQVEEALRGMTTSVGTVRRLRARLSWRSLRRARRGATPRGGRR